MSKFPSEAIQAGLAEVEADEESMIKLAAEMFRAHDGEFYLFDLLAASALNRSVALSSGFRKMIRANNLICAGALVRLELDTAIRFFAGFIVDQPHEFAFKVLEGNRISWMKDRDGNSMTDRNLLVKLAREYPWVEEVYEKASSYVHLSETHMLSSLSMMDRDSGKVEIKISSIDRTFPDDIYIDAINTFRACASILARYVDGWRFTKDNPDEVAQMMDIRENKQQES